MPQKQPDEYQLVGVTMTRALISGEALVASNAKGSLSVIAIDEAGVDQSVNIIDGVPYISGNDVIVMTMGGSDGDIYNLKWMVPTSLGQYLEEDDTLTIIEEYG